MHDCEKLLSLLQYPEYSNGFVITGDRTIFNPFINYCINLINNLLV